MFNWLSVVLLVVVEVVTGAVAGAGYLEYITAKMVDTIGEGAGAGAGGGKSPDFLKVITKPFTKSIVQLDKKILKGWAHGDPKYENVSSVLKSHCGDTGCSYLFYGLSSEGTYIIDLGCSFRTEQAFYLFSQVRTLAMLVSV